MSTQTASTAVAQQASQASSVPSASSDDAGVAMTTKDFKAELDRLVSRFDEVLELNAQIAQLPKGKTYELPDGRKIGRREFNQARAQYVTELKNLYKPFMLAHKPKKRTGARRPGTGFRIPIRVSENLCGFFREANLGLVDPRDPKSGALKEQVPLLIEGCITSAALLTPLFSIYAIVNNLTSLASSNRTDPRNPKSALLPADQMNHQMLGADALMTKWFGSTFNLLRSRGSHMTENGSEIPAFDPHNFKYASFQSLVSLNRRTRDGKIKRKVGAETVEEDNPAGPALTPEEVAILDPNNKDEAAVKLREELEREQRRVSETLTIYREMNKPAQKELRKGKRKTTRTAPAPAQVAAAVASAGKR
jgi:hypothetical protein